MVINKENIKVNEFDKIYCELLKQILNEGCLTKNRTGIDTVSTEGIYFKLNDIENNFPILESKKVFIKNALSEILWIYQAQSNNVLWLKERNNHIWDEWEIDEDGIYRIYEQNNNDFIDKKVEVKDINGNVLLDECNKPVMTTSNIENKTIKSAIYYGKEWANTIGTAYGWINNKFKRPQYVLNQIKNNPQDRRMNISLWQDEYIKTAVLPSCVWSSEWKVQNGKLHCFVHQRSADVPLGLPFNVSQYAILLNLFSKVSGLEAGNLNYSIMDAHIYVNQIDGIKKQLQRYEKMLEIEKMANNYTNDELENYLIKLKKIYDNYSKKYIENPSDEIKKLLDDAKNEYEIFKFMMDKKKPILDIVQRDNFFEYCNDVNNNIEYLKTNPTGNKEIKLLNYSSLPFIKMPVAQ